MPRKRELLIWATAAVVVVLSRLAHQNILWIEEAYGIAAARELVAGKELYREIWFDKPPGYALYYASFGAQTGFVLRLIASLFVLLTAWTASVAAGNLWSSRERTPAFVFTCFALTFWIPSAVQAVTPDLLILPLLLGSLGALLACQPLLAGVLAGLALWCNSKSLLLSAPLLMWCTEIREIVTLLAGYIGVQLSGLLLLDRPAYFAQVWAWGIGYSRDSFVTSPAVEFFRRTGGWAWFHSSLLLSALLSARHELRLVLWVAAGLAAVCAGTRFFPRYYFALLPPIILLASRGWTISGRRTRVVILALATIPSLRFGPKYVELLTTPGAAESWSDLTMMLDSRLAARLLSDLAKPGSTLLVWGYRPDIYVFSGLPAGTPYLDSQALNGVLADRHLTKSNATFPDLARANRRQLVRSSTPSYIVDGLGPLNPSLAVDRYEDLRPLLSQYRVVAKTALCIIYELQSSQSAVRN